MAALAAPEAVALSLTSINVYVTNTEYSLFISLLALC